MALTLIQATVVLESLYLAKEWAQRESTQDQEVALDKAIKYIAAAMKDKMSIGEYEEEEEEQSEEDMTVHSMRKSYGER